MKVLNQDMFGLFYILSLSVSVCLSVCLSSFSVCSIPTRLPVILFSFSDMSRSSQVICQSYFVVAFFSNSFSPKILYHVTIYFSFTFSGAIPHPHRDIIFQSTQRLLMDQISFQQLQYGSVKSTEVNCRQKI